MQRANDDWTATDLLLLTYWHVLLIIDLPFGVKMFSQQTTANITRVKCEESLTYVCG